MTADAPSVELRLSADTADPSLILEGSDVTLVCHVLASKPEARTFDWYWNDQPVDSSRPGLRANKGVLTMQRVGRFRSGTYSCSARNVHGVGRSRSVTIKVSRNATEPRFSLSLSLCVCGRHSFVRTWTRETST